MNKRRAETDLDKEMEEELDDDDSQNILKAGDETIGKAADVCQALMDRYGRSSAPQHRHLLASAVAMRSILEEEGLPLTPPAYFAAAITAVRGADHHAAAAIATFFAILLPLLPPQSISSHKAADAASIVVVFLKDPPSGTATGTVRSMVKSLGYLALRLDLEDWSGFQLPLETLLAFSLDRRPKVRRCAQECIEKVFRSFQSSFVIKKASKVVVSVYNMHITFASEIYSNEHAIKLGSTMPSKIEHMEILHMLNTVKLTVPNLSKKARMYIFSDVCKRLGSNFSLLSRPILSLLEALLEDSEDQVVLCEGEYIILTLATYISSDKKNPADTIISSSTLLRNIMSKLYHAQRSTCMKIFPLVFTSVAGYLCSDVDMSKHAADILKDLLNLLDDKKSSLVSAKRSSNYGKESSLETINITSICELFDDMLDMCGVPSEHILDVLSTLFLKLGEFSYVYMRDVLLKLSQLAAQGDEETPNKKLIQECIGAAVTAMGPEKILLLIPISLHAKELTCSNAWLLPILKKSIVGAPIQYFVERIVPLAESFKDAFKKVPTVKILQSYAHQLWDLLPSFCRYPTDTSQSFNSLANILAVALKDDPFLLETVARAFQELVNENRSAIQGTHDAKLCGDLQIKTIYKDIPLKFGSLPTYLSKKTASRNINAMASSSMDLIQTLTGVFFHSPNENCTFLKEAIECLSFVVGSENIQKFFASMVEKLELNNGGTELGSFDGNIQEGSKTLDARSTTEGEKHKGMRSLVLELASCFIEAADADLIHIIYDFLKPSLLDADGICHCEAYYTLSRIIKEHNWFCTTSMGELVDLLLSLKSPTDFTAIKNRFSCFHYLLVDMLKRNEENMEKAFLVLNEIILTLKSKKESRKLAYDALLCISCSLECSQSADSESHLRRLLHMVMGYLSSPSPHIISGAVAALSVLIYNNTAVSLIPNLIPSVLILMQKKDNEVIKAVLGFIKVLASSLSSDDLLRLLPEIMDAILPWSSVSKHHFRSKVVIILEILIRKCGSDAVEILVPEKFKKFVKDTVEVRHRKKNSKGVVDNEIALEPTDSVTTGRQKRLHASKPNPPERHSEASSYVPRERKRRRQEMHSATNNTRYTKGVGEKSQSTYTANTFKSSNKNKTWRNINDRPMGGNKFHGEKKENKFKQLRVVSRSAATAKAQKHRKYVNPRKKSSVSG